MLRRFSVRNYRCFASEVVLDLGRTRAYDFNDFAIERGVVRCLLLHGNGKTCLGSALCDITCGAAAAGDFRPNDPSEDVEFSYLFDFRGRPVSYSYSRNADGLVVSERLETEDFLFSGEDVLKERAEDGNEDARMVRKWAEGVFRADGVSFGEAEGHVVPGDAGDRLSTFFSEVFGKPCAFRTSSGSLEAKSSPGWLPFAEVASERERAVFRAFASLEMAAGASLVWVDGFTNALDEDSAKALCRKFFNLPGQVVVATNMRQLMVNQVLRPDCNFKVWPGGVEALSDMTSKEIRRANDVAKLDRGGQFGI